MHYIFVFFELFFNVFFVFFFIVVGIILWWHTHTHTEKTLSRRSIESNNNNINGKPMQWSDKSNKSSHEDPAWQRTSTRTTTTTSFRNRSKCLRQTFGKCKKKERLTSNVWCISVCVLSVRYSPALCVLLYSVAVLVICQHCTICIWISNLLRLRLRPFPNRWFPAASVVNSNRKLSATAAAVVRMLHCCRCHWFM